MNASSLKVRVDAVRDEAVDIRSYRISRVDGYPFDAYEPGAHIDVTSPAGVTRQYSLCGDPDHTLAQLFAVKKEKDSRGGSRSLHDDVAVGSELWVSAPRNLFQLAYDADRTILIAAGIGITPLLSMAYRLAQNNASFVLHYFARSGDHAAFAPLLSEPPFAGCVQFHLQIERDALDAKLEACFAEAGAGTHVYTCGPAPFMDRVTQTASRFVPEDAIHLERFGAPVESAPSADACETFEVRLSQSGRRVTVEKGQSVVDALAAIGVEIETSCGEGVCGTCMVDVVEGTPDHRDHCLSKAERASNAVICCCVSRSRTPLLVLDL
ncbi:oxidoreductase [Trinickia violacea]|uniref:Oxidoreductase n=1 Tax=Trinickia violacea TaxID=2571746 RepID=A0A4P8IXF9_9BURK|nr:PDR/VanB family oxidoreductase [Trinickia violacea]QCP54078.1 oxidoreductase [Trinickia violacea]